MQTWYHFLLVQKGNYIIPSIVIAVFANGLHLVVEYTMNLAQSEFNVTKTIGKTEGAGGENGVSPPSTLHHNIQLKAD